LVSPAKSSFEKSAPVPGSFKVIYTFWLKAPKGGKFFYPYLLSIFFRLCFSEVEVVSASILGQWARLKI
jgi:hypothetical protein